MSIENEEVRGKRKERISVKGKTRASKLNRRECINKGKAYLSTNGKPMKVKEYKPLKEYKSMCKDRFTNDDRRKMYLECWSLSDNIKHTAYVATVITTQEKKEVEDVNKQKMLFLTHKYHLRVNGESAIHL